WLVVARACKIPARSRGALLTRQSTGVDAAGVGVVTGGREAETGPGAAAVMTPRPAPAGDPSRHGPPASPRAGRRHRAERWVLFRPNPASAGTAVETRGNRRARAGTSRRSDRR